MSTDRWMNKEDVHIYSGILLRGLVHIYTMEYYSNIKMNEILPFAATWMDLEIIILSELSLKEKDKYHMISLTSGI